VAMLAPLALTAFAMILARPVPDGRLFARTVAGLILALSALDAVQLAARPRTNAVEVAEYLNRAATPDDLVLVVPVYVASSLSRYYHGIAPIAGYPDGAIAKPLEFDDRIERDTTVASLARVPAMVQHTFDAGGRVWVVSAPVPAHLAAAWQELEEKMRGQGRVGVPVSFEGPLPTVESLELRRWEPSSPMRQSGR